MSITKHIFLAILWKYVCHIRPHYFGTVDNLRSKCLGLLNYSVGFALRTMFYGIFLQTIVSVQAANGTSLSLSPSHFKPVSVIASDLISQPILISWSNLSPDGRLFAYAEGVQIRVWEVESGRLLKTFKGKSNERYHSSWSVAFSPNSKLLASGSDGNPIKVWDIESGDMLRAFEDKPARASSIAFSPDGKLLASGGRDKTIRLWDIPSGKQIRSFAENSGFINYLAFSPDGQLLASADGNKTASLWDVKSGRQVKSFEVRHAAYVDFLRNGKVLAIIKGDGTMFFRGVKNEKDAESLNSITRGIKSMVFSPDGKLIAVTKPGEKTIRLWDIENERELRSFEPDTDESLKTVRFSTDSKMLAMSSNKTIKFWDVKSGKLLRSINSQYGNLRGFFPGGRLIGFWGKTIYRWDLKSGKEFKSILN